MLILTLRTDKPESEIGLYNDQIKIAYEVWPAHRQLAETIHNKIAEILNANAVTMPDLQAVVVYKGPGSFTGLRIGLTVGNALAYGLQLPIVSSQGEDWLLTGIARLLDGQNETIAMPEYGAEPNITQPKH